jgi:hypothetical protein
MLDKRGNSNHLERIDLLTQFVELVGIKRMGCIIGDREFIGEKWYNYLISNDISFYLRLPKSHKVIINNVESRIDTLVNSYIPEQDHWLNDIFLGKIKLNIGFRKLLSGRQGRKKDDYLAVITNEKGSKALKEYKKRWSIETFFQSRAWF